MAMKAISIMNLKGGVKTTVYYKVIDCIAI